MPYEGWTLEQYLYFLEKAQTSATRDYVLQINALRMAIGSCFSEESRRTVDDFIRQAFRPARDTSRDRG